MSKQSIIDETQILQLHEGQARQLLHMWTEGRIDLDVGEYKFNHSIESALQTLCDILDRSIRNRNQQIDADDEPRNEYGYDPDRL